MRDNRDAQASRSARLGRWYERTGSADRLHHLQRHGRPEPENGFLAKVYFASGCGRSWGDINERA